MSETQNHSLVSREVLDRIQRVLQPSENGCLVRRRLPDSLVEIANEIQGLEAFERTVRVRNDAEINWLLAPFEQLASERLRADMVGCVEAFVALNSGAPIVASLVLTRGDDCRKYHVDWVGLRLLITYSGPGTEWVPEHAVNRFALSEPWHDLEEINRAIVPDRSQVVRAGAGDVLVLKGESYPGNQGRGAVHRSPPIAGGRVARLVFKLTSPTKFHGRSTAREC